MRLQKCFFFFLLSCAYLETLFNWDEESVEAVSIEDRLLFVLDHTLIKAPDAMSSDIEWISVCEEG